MDEFNRQLQEYLEGTMRAAAMEALLQRGGLESVGAGGSKATMGVLRAELEQVKQMLAKGQEEAKQEAKETKEGVLSEVKKTKQEVQETKHELTVLSVVQEETKQQISALEGKIDSILTLLQGSGRS
jgi:septal ring factor EnvC (AmiA/AmiB activator)